MSVSLSMHVMLTCSLSLIPAIDKGIDVRLVLPFQYNTIQYNTIQYMVVLC